MKLPSPLALTTLAVDFAGFLDGGEKFSSGLAEILRGNLEGFVHTCEMNAASSSGWRLTKASISELSAGLADEVGNIDGEEVAGCEEAIDGGEVMWSASQK